MRQDARLVFLYREFRAGLPARFVEASNERRSDVRGQCIPDCTAASHWSL